MQLSDFTKMQLQQSIETYRVQLSLLVQICTVFVVADATTVGYAVQQRLGAVLWVGLIFPVSIILVIRVVVRMSIPILATAVSIETRYANPEIGGFVSTFVAATISQDFLNRIRSAGMLNDEQLRTRALVKLNKPYLFSGGRVVKRMLYLIILGQAVAPFLLWRFAGWGLLNK